MNGDSGPVIVSASELVVVYGDQTVLKNAALTVLEGERIGVVGRNGAGKSTLLKILAGEDSYEPGTMSRRKELTSALLPQEAVLEPNSTIHQNIIAGASTLLQMIKRFENLPAHSRESVALEAAIAAKGGWQIERRIEEICSRLGVPDVARLAGTLSGGERRRVSLARTLLTGADLLLLDEPTNHLDTEAIEWLQTYLHQYPGTCMFITHDRHFLDRVTTRIVEVANGLIYSHPGSYTDFLTNKTERMAQAEREEQQRQSFLRREIEWIRRGPKARTTKSQSRIDRFNEVVEKKPVQRDRDIELIIPPADKLPNRILECHDLTVTRGGRQLFSKFNLEFQAGARIGIIGPNGVGKTTLLKVILGDVPPDSGTVVTGDLTRFNYVDQQRVQLNDDRTVFQEIADGNEFIRLGNERLSAWTYLKRFMFTDDRIRTLVGRLSGGERSRLMLAKILKEGGNFLILDEPTNDLDLQTLRILEEALVNFEGCVLLVSHDRFFLDRICTGILSFEQDGKLLYQEGNYSYYVQKRQERLRQQTEDKVVAAPQTNSISQEPCHRNKSQKKLKWKEQRELDQMEHAVLMAEAEVENLESLFAAPDFYETYGQNAKELAEKLDAARERVRYLYARWDELEQFAKIA